MTQSSIGKPSLPPAESTWGAAAVASVAEFTVEVDESTTSDEVRLTVESPRISISHRFADSGRVIEMLESFRKIVAGEPSNMVLVCPACNSQLSLARDEEGDRFYLSSSGSDPEFRITLSRLDVRDLTEAFVDVANQLRD